MVRKGGPSRILQQTLQPCRVNGFRQNLASLLAARLAKTNPSAQIRARRDRTETLSFGVAAFLSSYGAVPTPSLLTRREHTFAGRVALLVASHFVIAVVMARRQPFGTCRCRRGRRRVDAATDHRSEQKKRMSHGGFFRPADHSLSPTRLPKV
jgi:hypothetical protein